MGRNFERPKSEEPGEENRGQVKVKGSRGQVESGSGSKMSGLMNRITPPTRKTIQSLLQRNIGFSAILAQKGQVALDPIQKLFVSAIKEYDQKTKAAGGKLVDPSPATEKELKGELERVFKMYGGKPGQDMTKLPPFEFKDPPIDPINQTAQ